MDLARRSLSISSKPDARQLPATRAECPTERPCPYLTCRHHMAVDDLGRGVVHVLDLPEGTSSCSLDVADAGPSTLEEVGATLGLTRERVRQIEESALRKVKLRAQKRLATFNEYHPEQNNGSDDWEKLLMARPKRKTAIYEPHAAQSTNPTPLPAGPTHCACGTFLEPLRRTAGHCRECIAAKFTLAEFGKGNVDPDAERWMPECPSCLRKYMKTTPHQKFCTRENCRNARKLAERKARQAGQLGGKAA
jgi:hypothetical protein